jgi:hypothetical protein
MNVSLPSISEVSTADAWFVALDRRSLIVGPLQLTMQVLGVHVDAIHTWIQIGLAEYPGSSLLLRLMPWATFGDALRIVRSEIAARVRSDAPTRAFTNAAGECRHLCLTIASHQIATA